MPLDIGGTTDVGRRFFHPTPYVATQHNYRLTVALQYETSDKLSKSDSRRSSRVKGIVPANGNTPEVAVVPL